MIKYDHTPNICFLNYFNLLCLSLFLPLSSSDLNSPLSITNSVTRLGDLLDFGQIYKAFGNN